MNKYIKLAVCLITVAFCFTSCGNFDEINTDPDVPTRVTAAMLASGGIKSMLGSPGAKDFVGLCFRRDAGSLRLVVAAACFGAVRQLAAGCGRLSRGDRVSFGTGSAYGSAAFRAKAGHGRRQFFFVGVGGDFA